jgi:hypothetical protein
MKTGLRPNEDSGKPLNEDALRANESGRSAVKLGLRPNEDAPSERMKTGLRPNEDSGKPLNEDATSD